jgi:hypothetical protein
LRSQSEQAFARRRKLVGGVSAARPSARAHGASPIKLPRPTTDERDVDAKELRGRIYDTIECFSELYGSDGKAELYSMIRDLEADHPPSGEGLADELRMANEARHGEGTYEARTLKVISHLIRAVKKLG